MQLKSKIVILIIAILSISLLINSLLTTRDFRTHYTNALLNGSLGLAQSLESMIDEMLNLGLPLNSLSGLDKKLAEVVEKNPHIVYAGIGSPQGKALFHSDPTLVGRVFDDPTALQSNVATAPLWQLYNRFDGKQYYDITIPLSVDKQLVGHIRLGFESAIIEETMADAIHRNLWIALATFIGIGLLLGILLNRIITDPIKQLADYARGLAKGDFQTPPGIHKTDEIGQLATTLQQMGDTLRQQIDALKHAGQVLESKVLSRTHELAEANHTLHRSNQDLLESLERQRSLSTALSVSEQRFRLLFENNRAVMLVIDPHNSNIVSANPAAADFYGYSLERLQGMSINAINTLGNRGITQLINKTIKEKGGEFLFRHKLASGTVRDVEVHSTPIEWDGRTLLYSIVHDITARKLAEDDLKQQAQHDPLTGLPNRLLKSDRLRQAIALCRRKDTKLAVCYLDLDGFKPVNDRFGHEVGDQLLIAIAQRLQLAVREGDTVSRIGGDEFVLILTELPSQNECLLIVDRILAAVAKPIPLGDISTEISASVGLTLYPDDDVEPDILMRHADQAMYVAKNRGKNQYHLFNPDEDRQVKAHVENLQRLRQAFTHNELLLFYQPKVNMLSGEVLGVEGLIRWQHPDMGLLPPGHFLHLMDGTDLEIDIGCWVINTALRQLADWQRQGLRLKIGVNISAPHLQHPQFVTQMREAIAAHPQADPHLLELEILETASINDTSKIMPTLLSCREMGIHFALDDFGTGYSSLSYFHHLPVDLLKIDQSFVRDMLMDPQDLAIVDSVVRLANAFLNPVIAEGVETREHAIALLSLGCHLGQGYGIGRPMPVEQLPAWLQQWQQNDDWQQLDRQINAHIQLDWQVALASHDKWLEQCVEQLQQGHAISNLPLNSRHCAFGRWFHGTGYHRYNHLPVYAEINKLHEQVHETTQMLSNQIETHCEDVLAKIPLLKATYDRLVDCITPLMKQQDDHHLPGEPPGS
jgi:diguanylate cyclase (GGDEF)-like protein/PAS domain S-box-containing protein